MKNVSSRPLVRSLRDTSFIALVALVAGGMFLISNGSVVKKNSPIAESTAIPRLTELLAMLEDELFEQDIAVLNLRAAEGLPGAQELDIATITKQLDRWANRVRSETDRCLPQFFAKPEILGSGLICFR